MRADVDAGTTQLVRAWIQGDVDMYVDCFTSDGALIRQGGEVLQGRDSIRAAMRQTFQRLRMTSGKAETTQLRFVDDHAYEIGTWSFAIGPIGEQARPDSGQYVTIWKEEDGRWRMWRVIEVLRTRT